MKKILLFIIVFTVFFGLRSLAQNTPDERVSNKTTFKGKRALRKEKRIHENASNLTASNERKARKRNAKGGLPRSSKKAGRNKEKNKPIVIEEKKLAEAEPSKD
jgi:hypothetical protein